MKKLGIYLYATIVLTNSCKAHDAPAFYRAPFFQGTPSYTISDFGTSLSARYGKGSATEGWAQSGSSTSLFSIYENINVAALGSNLEGLSASFKPTTYTYLRKSGGLIPSYGFTGNDGTITLNGSFTTEEASVDFYQNVIKGFFLHAYVPMRSLHIGSISVTNNTNPANANATAFQNFLDNNLNTVLSENGYSTLKSDFKDEGIGDLFVSAGWHGYNKHVFGVIKDLAGFLEMGATIPLARNKKLNSVGALPLGYDGFYGFHGRGGAQAFLFDWFSIGANAGVTVFIAENRLQRMITDTSQSGIIALEKGVAHVNPGALWDIGIFGAFHVLQRSLFGLVGLSLTEQEATTLHVDDNLFLKTFLATQLADTTIIRKSSQDSIVNTDNRYHLWQLLSLHLMLSYDAQYHMDAKWAPKLSLSYDYPFSGKLAFKTAMIGGSAGLSARWNF